MNNSYVKTVVFRMNNSYIKTVVLRMNNSFVKTVVFRMNNSYVKTVVLRMNNSYVKTVSRHLRFGLESCFYLVDVTDCLVEFRLGRKPVCRTLRR